MNTYIPLSAYGTWTLAFGAVVAAAFAAFGVPFAIYGLSVAIQWLLPFVLTIGDVVIRVPSPETLFYTISMYVLAALAAIAAAYFLREIHRRWRNREASGRVLIYSGTACLSLIVIALVSYVYIPLFS